MSARTLLLTSALAAAAFAALASPAHAGTIEVGKSAGYTGAWGGGEFAVTSYDGGPSGTTPGSGVAVDGSFFQTFCLELSEPIVSGVTYDFTVGTSAEGGGAGGGSPDPLDSRTAYLYSKFWNGTLSDYDYSTGSGREASATSLQLALWYLEEEFSGGTLSDAFDDDAQAQAWVDEANDAVATGGAWAGMGIGSVRILNLTENGENRQSVLTVIPLPPAALLGFGTLAVTCFMALRRRRQVG